MTHEQFTDDEGNRFDLTADIYNPKPRDVNRIIRASIGRQLVAGTFTDF